MVAPLHHPDNFKFGRYSRRWIPHWLQPRAGSQQNLFTHYVHKSIHLSLAIGSYIPLIPWKWLWGRSHQSWLLDGCLRQQLYWPLSRNEQQSSCPETNAEQITTKSCYVDCCGYNPRVEDSTCCSNIPPLTNHLLWRSPVHVTVNGKNNLSHQLLIWTALELRQQQSAVAYVRHLWTLAVVIIFKIQECNKLFAWILRFKC